MQLAQEEQSEINRLVTELEAKSGAQVLVVIVPRADAYPEIPWKAFAMGAVFAGLAVATGSLHRAAWAAAHPALITAAISGAGAALAVLAILVPWFARLFVPWLRAKMEVRQYAQGVFLKRGVFATRERVGVLLLISRFEREAVILADAGIRKHVTEEQLAATAARMKPLLAENRMVEACAAGLGSLGRQLQDVLPHAPPTVEFADAVIAERGA